MDFKPYPPPITGERATHLARDLCWRVNGRLPDVQDKHTVTPAVVAVMAWVLGLDDLDTKPKKRLLDAFGLEWVEGAMDSMLLQPKPEFLVKLPDSGHGHGAVPDQPWFDLRMKAADLARQHGYAAIVRVHMPGTHSLRIAIGADLEEVEIRAAQMGLSYELLAEFDADGKQS